MAKKVKQICAGVVAAVALSGAGAYFINKWLEEDSKKKKEHETEQVVKDMSTQGISVTKKGAKDAPDSVLVSVKEHNNIYGEKVYHDPQYKARENEDPKTFRLDKKVKEWITDAKDKETMRIVAEKIKELTKNGATGDSIKSVLEEIAKQRPMHAPVEEKTQYFGYDKDKNPFGLAYSSAEAKTENKSEKSNGAEWRFDVEVRQMSTGAHLAYDFRTNDPEEMLKRIRDNNKDNDLLADHFFEDEQGYGVIKTWSDGKPKEEKAEDNELFGKIEKATANVRRHAEEFSGSLRFENPDEQQLAAKQQRAPKKKNSKRKMSRDALPGRNLAQIKANKKQNG